MKKIAIAFLIFFSTFVYAETNNSAESTSIFTKKQKLDREGVELYASNTEMKSFKKLGLGLMLGSATGVLGLNAEFNLDPNEALAIGLGAGPSYGTFSVGWKYNFDAQYLFLYTKVGYSKWFSSSGNSATDSDILKRIFSDKELREGHFGADFLTGGFGLEYNQLEGDMAGVNFFGEITLLAEITQSTFIPTGGVGIIYYY